jgi:hypothetical protein
VESSGRKLDISATSVCHTIERVLRRNIYNSTFIESHIKHCYFVYFRVMLQLNRPFVICLIFAHRHSVQNSIIRQECYNSQFRMFHTHTYLYGNRVWTKCSCTELTKNPISIIPEWTCVHPQSTLPPSECNWPNAFSVVEKSVACPSKLGSSEASSFNVWCSLHLQNVHPA